MTIDYQIQCDAFNSFPTHELTFVRVSQSLVFVGIQILYQNNGFISPVDGVEEKIVDIIKHYGHGENDQILHKNCVFGEFVYIYILYENIRNWCCVFEICSQIIVQLPFCFCLYPLSTRQCCPKSNGSQKSKIQYLRTQCMSHIGSTRSRRLNSVLFGAPNQCPSHTQSKWSS